MKTYCAIADYDEWEDREIDITYCGSSLSKAKKSLSSRNADYDEWVKRGIQSREIIVWEGGKTIGFYDLNEKEELSEFKDMNEA